MLVINKSLKLFYIISIAAIVVFLYRILNQNNNITSSRTEDKAEEYEVVATEANFEGVSKDKTSYRITAQNAIKVSEDTYRLNQVKGYYFPHNVNLVIKSNAGVLNNNTSLINLEGKVRALGYGFIISSETLDINLITEEIFGNDRIEIEYENLKINADKFQIKDKNLVIIEGDVKSRIDLK